MLMVLEHYRRKIANLNVYEQKKRDLYLRKLSLGEIQGPMTGYCSLDKPFLKFQSEEAILDTVPTQTIYQRIYECNQDNLDGIALIYQDVQVTFRELFENIDRVAKSLIASGVKAGDRVSLCMPNIPETVYTMYALNKIGAVANMIEPRTNAKRIKQYVNEAQSSKMIMVDLCKNNIDRMIYDEDCSLDEVICVSAVNSFSAGIKKRIYQFFHPTVKDSEKYKSWDTFLKRGEGISEVPTFEYREKYPAIIVYTGGTTSIPKGAILPNETYNGQNMQFKYSGISKNREDRFLGDVPFFSAYGSSCGMHNALCSGVSICLVPTRRPQDFYKLLKKYKPTITMEVPRTYEMLYQKLRGKKNENLSYMKDNICGGDKIPSSRELEVNKEAKSHGAPAIKKGLGMSEFGGGITTTVSDETNLIGSVGIPLVQNNIKIVDPNTKEEVPYGQMGELYATGPTQMLGYLNREDEDERFFEMEGNIRWGKTGDLVQADFDGIVTYLDRIKRAIMLPDGHTVPLVPIENAISMHPQVKNCAVVGVSNSMEQTGKVPMAFVVLNDERVDMSQIEMELRKLCDENIPPREIPQYYKILPELPYTLMEKVDFEKLSTLGTNLVLKGDLEPVKQDTIYTKVKQYFKKRI
ncbi:MAG: acyl--CoA ligase [Bacilli bacterium]|nr:acyl--CoA ligase [Bacilli bacterium]